MNSNKARVRCGERRKRDQEGEHATVVWRLKLDQQEPGSLGLFLLRFLQFPQSLGEP